MALVVKDRIRETATTTGTGTLTLEGAVRGFDAFSEVGAGNTCYYAIFHRTADEFEVGLGTVGSGTLSRDTIYESSNSDNAVNLTTGTKDVFLTVPASKVPYLQSDGTSTFFDPSGTAVALAIALG